MTWAKKREDARQRIIRICCSTRIRRPPDRALVNEHNPVLPWPMLYGKRVITWPLFFSRRSYPPVFMPHELFNQPRICKTSPAARLPSLSSASLVLPARASSVITAFGNQARSGRQEKEKRWTRKTILIRPGYVGVLLYPHRRSRIMQMHDGYSNCPRFLRRMKFESTSYSHTSRQIRSVLRYKTSHTLR